MQFRTLAASNPQLQWNLRHSEFWLDNLASQTWPCTYCGSTSHFPNRCPRYPFRTGHLSNDNASQQDNGYRLFTCRDINNPTCQRNPCCYQHCCQHCGSPTHPAYRCGGCLFPAEVLGPRTHSPLRPLILKCKLADHPNKAFVQQLISNVVNGCAIGYNGPQFAAKAKHLSSALQHPTIIDESLKLKGDRSWTHTWAL